MAKQMQMSQKSGSGRENLQSAEAQGYNQPKVKVAISRRLKIFFTRVSPNGV